MNSNKTASLADGQVLPAATGAPAEGTTAEFDGLSAVAFFPGLGSRSAYRDIDSQTIGAASPAAATVYEQAAQALGQVPTRRSLATDARSLPEDPVARQGYIGAAFLTHNLAIYSDLQHQNGPSKALRFSAYTGESFGMLAAAVASGTLHVRDGALLAYAFTPILLGATGQRAKTELAVDLAPILPRDPADTVPVSEPAHVIALRGKADDLKAFMTTLKQVLGESVELHKRYSPQQSNIYVYASAISAFVRVLHSYPEITAEELKKPTTFLAHSPRMAGAREAFERFITAQGIEFSDPHTPLISNSGGGFLLTGGQVRDAVLSMADEVMDSQRTTELIDDLQPDVVTEIGRGRKSLQLLRDNAVRPGAISISSASDAQRLVQMAALTRQLNETIRTVDGRAKERLNETEIAVLRDLSTCAARESAFDVHLRRTALSLASESLRNPKKNISSASMYFREALQYTLAHRDRVGPGEVVLGARLRKRLLGSSAETGHAYLELRVISENGTVRDDEVTPTKDTEVLVIHFERPTRSRNVEQIRHDIRSSLQNSPVAQRINDSVHRQVQDHATLADSSRLADLIARADAVEHVVYQSAMFELFQQHRPGMFAHSHVFLEATDLFGWTTSLVISKAIEPCHSIDILTHLLQNRSTVSARLRALVATLCEKIHDAKLPLLSTSGSPVLTKGDLRRETMAFLNRSASRRHRRPIQLQASATVVALAYGSTLPQVDTSPHHKATLLVRTPEELWRNGLHRDLDAIESHALLSATRTHRAVREFAQTRNMLYSTVNSYVHPGEQVAGFGAGGSESMTIFFRREDHDELLVRKILSEALTTARWDSAGTGAMLPPFTKAKRQAEYLSALPEVLGDFLPRVKNVVERQIKAIGPDDGSQINRELIYEMTFIDGVEVGEYVRRYQPPAAVIAKLYEQIMNFIHHKVHSHRRAPSPGDTLEEQYFRKIEDRLLLCRRTAPKTFGPELLDADAIVINGQRYHNYRSLLHAFRSNEDYRDTLEPRVHALVIGDTNTENIKISEITPLNVAAQRIRMGASEHEIQEALAAITPSSIGLKFLDPRAIGFRTEGAETVDDPMYDNKPWHNSIGHYDEIHNEYFDLDLSVTTDGTPSIAVRFHDGNPYREAYQVRDVTEHGGTINRISPSGIEDYFSEVMAAVYESDESTKSQHARDDPYWITRFVFTMGTHFTAMPPFHFASEIDGSIIDSPEVQRRPLAIYCEGIKWLNWALEMLEGTRPDFLGVPAKSAQNLSNIQ